ncbi:MAG: hypothetical protein OM95_13450 [Bdellovibrio sp. ArHS]|uniref:phospholipase D-like domain-containing protein n=1 Tax=Bdellovibrio sp. ArHS TaxID=1569284 RepID=UPI000583B9BB|nr:phospholipase D-like domain-containing protein [Bdellovibrio sp. ArHS]KHD87592.1 MAG: hypothetical protein OM95_13450 [Bdellovibrio sp. ArHS]
MTQKKISGDTALVTDDDYLGVLLDLLDTAKFQINILAYSFAIGSAAGKLNMSTAPYAIAEKLKDLKHQNPSLRIRLYIEGVRDTSDRNLVTAQFLKRAGVEVMSGKTHAKGFSVDGRYVLVEMIRSAKKSLEFSIYFFDHKEIRDAFIEAHRRGVKVKGFAHHHTAFALSYVRRTRRTIERLQEEGIDSLYFAPGSFFTHSKYLIKDRQEVALGTGNWLVEDVEIHPQLYIHLKNRDLAQQLAKHLAKQIAKQRDAFAGTRTKPRHPESHTRLSESKTAR